VTLKQAIVRASARLAANKDIDNPPLVAEILLRHALNISRVQLYADMNRELSAAKSDEFDKMVTRQLQGEPVAYITRHKEFYGLDYFVDSRVLVPRPESELLVELALDFAKGHPVAHIADIGTGSGAIAISLAVHLPQARVYAIDLSPEALEVARLNTEKHGVIRQITLLEGDLLEPLPVPADIIIANLPYVRKSDLAGMPSARYEPALALDGGESGLEKIFQLCRRIEVKLNPEGCLLMEIGMGQGQSVIEHLRRLYPSAAIREIPDLAGIGRVIRVSFQPA
jgi:release factor glutamine methyltransferase